MQVLCIGKSLHRNLHKFLDFIPSTTVSKFYRKASKMVKIKEFIFYILETFINIYEADNRVSNSKCN